MTKTFPHTSDSLQTLLRTIYSHLEGHQTLIANFSGEQSQFIRFNQSKLRQSGWIEDASLDLTLLVESRDGIRTSSGASNLTGNSKQDEEQMLRVLSSLQKETPTLPVDPFMTLPENTGDSNESFDAQSPPVETSGSQLSRLMASYDVAGIFVNGRVYRANANSLGQFHWWDSASYNLDYSMYGPEERAVKGFYAGQNWSDDEVARQLTENHQSLEVLARPLKELQRGKYRTYLAPASVAEFLDTLSWGGLSEAGLRQGSSPFMHLRSKEKTLSPLFSLSEDFASGRVPRFNSRGEQAPPQLSIIDSGELKNMLVSTRSAKEYGIKGNAANSSEGLRSATVGTGTLGRSEILKSLGEGLYLSNLHYLNWSDRPGGRITGMTRYACFWVENGELTSPIQDLRFDDTVFNLFGSELENITNFRELIPETGTYDRREVGGSEVPGLLLKNMEFTL